MTAEAAYLKDVDVNLPNPSLTLRASVIATQVLIRPAI